MSSVSLSLSLSLMWSFHPKERTAESNRPAVCSDMVPPDPHCNATQNSFLKEMVHRSRGFFLNKQRFISNCPNYANSPDLSQRALNTEVSAVQSPEGPAQSQLGRVDCARGVTEDVLA